MRVLELSHCINDNHLVCIFEHRRSVEAQLLLATIMHVRCIIEAVGQSAAAGVIIDSDTQRNSLATAKLLWKKNARSVISVLYTYMYIYMYTQI